MTLRITDVKGNAIRQGGVYIVRNITNKAQFGPEMRTTSLLYMTGNVHHETETTIAAGLHTQKHASTSLSFDENPIYAFRIDQLDQQPQQTNNTTENRTVFRMRLVNVWCNQSLGAGRPNRGDGGFPVVDGGASILTVMHHRNANRQRTNRGIYRIGIQKDNRLRTGTSTSDPSTYDIKQMVFLDSWELDTTCVPTWWPYRDSSSQWWSFVPFLPKPLSYSLVQLSRNSDIRNAFSVTIQNNDGKYLRRIRPVVEHVNTVPHVRFDLFTPTMAGTLPSSFVWQLQATNELHHLYTLQSTETSQSIALIPQKGTFDIAGAGISLPRTLFLIEYVSGLGDSMRFRIRSAYAFTQYPDDSCATSVVHTDMNAYAMNLDKSKRKTDDDSLFTVTVVRDLDFCLKNVELMSSPECKAQCDDQTTNTRNQCNEKINRFCATSLKNLLTTDVCRDFGNEPTNESACRMALQKLCNNATPDERAAYGADCACFLNADYYTPKLETFFPSRLFPNEQLAVKDLSPACWFPSCSKLALNWKKPKDPSCSIGNMQPFSECLKVQIRRDVGNNVEAYKNNIITECFVRSGGGQVAHEAHTNPSSVCITLVLVGILALLLMLLHRCSRSRSA